MATRLSAKYIDLMVEISKIAEAKGSFYWEDVKHFPYDKMIVYTALNRLHDGDFIKKEKLKGKSNRFIYTFNKRYAKPNEKQTDFEFLNEIFRNFITCTEMTKIYP